MDSCSFLNLSFPFFLYVKNILSDAKSNKDASFLACAPGLKRSLEKLLLKVENYFFETGSKPEIGISCCVSFLGYVTPFCRIVQFVVHLCSAFFFNNTAN